MFTGGEKQETPYLIMDLSEVSRRYRALIDTFPKNTEIFYSVKANPHTDVLNQLAGEGSGFDVASWKEVNDIIKLGVPAEKIAFSNPIKIHSDISKAHSAGVKLFAFDSEAEIKKLAELAPGCEVYVRLVVSNEGSLWPLTKKFGVDYREAVRLTIMAKEMGLDPIGATFHVGSQCLNPVNWGAALRVTHEVFKECERNGINLSMVNMGGGLPAQDRASNPPEIREVCAVIKKELERFDKDIRIIIEPGRHMVATSGVLVTTVIGEAERAGKKWLYLDTGVYNGLMEIYEGFPYELRTANPTAPQQEYVIAGPTCDSVDVVYEKVVIPQVRVGDKLYFMNAGAYTNSYDGYNGFPFPRVVHKEKTPERVLMAKNSAEL